MNRYWNHIVGPLLRATEPKTVCEIGAQAGVQTKRLLDLCAEIDAISHVIDPAPTFDVDAWSQRYGARFRFHRARSLEVLPELNALDAVLIDGDHNWFTVFHELKVLDEPAGNAVRTAPLVILHDVGWPYGRRDVYYFPEDIPKEHRHPHARRPVAPGDTGMAERGLNPHLFHATLEGGPRNGVLTAIEDFIAQSSRDWKLFTVEAFHGLGVLVSDERAPAGSRLDDALRRLGSAAFFSELVCDLEHARIAAELAACRWRAEAETAAAKTGRAPAAKH
jgi:hypothetical protein